MSGNDGSDMVGWEEEEEIVDDYPAWVNRVLEKEGVVTDALPPPPAVGHMDYPVGDDTDAWSRFGVVAQEGSYGFTPAINGRTVTPQSWDWRIVAAWIVFVLYGLGLEFFTLLDGNDSTPPLTWVVIRWVPEVIGIGFVSWLLYHFAMEYWKNGSGRAE